MSEKDRGGYWYDALWKLLRAALIITAGLSVVIGCCFAGFRYLNDNFIAPYEEESVAPVQVNIERRSSVSSIANILEENQLIRSTTAFKLYVEMMDATTKIKPGEYALTRDMSLGEILDNLTMGDGEPVERTITIIPGNTVEDIGRYLRNEGILPDQSEFLAICKKGEPFADYTLMKEIKQTSEYSGRKYLLEGYIAPDTYRIYTDSTPEAIITRLLGQTDMIFSGDYYSRAQELDMTVDEVITLASIIEKEAKTEDFKRVSAVFHKRLEEDMRLESCATVQYVLGVNRLALTDADMSISSGFNTYRNNGLPLGPICNPSPDAIEAALYPDEGFMEDGYLFFCSKDPKTGELAFSKTLEEHEANSALYRPLWIQNDRERGVAAV